MRAELNNLIQKFFSRPDLESMPLDELEHFVHQYPYSIFGRFLLDQKKIESNGVSGRLPMDSSTLYFNNPLWLNLLRQRVLREEPLEDYRPENPFPTEAIHPPQEKPAADVEESLPEFSAAARTSPELADSLAGDERSTQREANLPEEQSPLQLADQLERQTAAVTKDLPMPEETLLDELTEMSTKVTGDPGDGQKEPAPEKKSTTADRPVFEPYHSVDYFASQGIRLQQSEFTKDRLGQQLRSFTEWIKTMKKLPEAEKQPPLDPGTERSINRIAQISLEEREIQTEAMAEVWAKQGNKAKAQLIYEKLSLQNPGKSAYFAAKIEQLNTSIG